MTPVPLPVQGLLVALVAVAAAYDYRFRRIPNWLVLTGMLAGFCSNIAISGFGGLKLAAGGFGLGFGLYFILYLIRAMGAGDVKLMAAVGSLVGAGNWFFIFLITAMLGGVVALVLIVLRGRVRKTLWNVAYIFAEFLHWRAPYVTREELDVKSGKGMSLPHGVVIAFGSLLFLGVMRLTS